MLPSKEKIIKKKTVSEDFLASPSIDLSRRKFLKMVALAGAVLVVGEMGKKVNTVIKNKVVLGSLEKGSKKTSNLSKISKDLIFSEDNKGVTFFDKSGSPLLVFEKES